MKLFQSLMIASLLGASVALPVFAGNGSPTKTPGQVVVPTLTAAEAATLSYMREEEKVARDVYLNLGKTYQSLVFTTISKSEQTHMNAMLKLLKKYRLPDPVSPLVGVFSDPVLQDLYGDMMAKGEVSYEEALQVGALIEEVDIADLQVAIAATTKADLKQAYGNLLRGSRNHLRAFVAEIVRNGDVYSAQVLSQDEVDAILAGTVERGGPGKRN